MHKHIPNHRLKLRPILVEFLDRRTKDAVAEGNNAAWRCDCGAQLICRCYFAWGHQCHTTCACGRTYGVIGDAKRRALRVIERPNAEPTLPLLTP